MSICQASWELATIGVEYLFMGKRYQHHGQFTQNNQDCEYTKIISLIELLEPNKTSGKYWHINAVHNIK